jgi:uncharacterized Tic20 family protein
MEVFSVNVNSEEKALSGIAHLAVLFGIWGLIANIVLHFVYREKSQFVAHHTKQALGLTVVSWVVAMVLGMLVLGTGFHFMMMPSAVLTGALLSILVLGAWSIVVLVLVIMGAVNGFQGQDHTYPIFGKMVDSIGK